LERVDLGGDVYVPVTFVGSGDEVNWEFSLKYDPAAVRFLEFKGVDHLTVMTTTDDSLDGSVAVWISLDSQQNALRGTNILTYAHFVVLQPNTTSSISIPVANGLLKVSDQNNSALTTAVGAGQVQS